jgi:DivIVA domain-containing protein
MIEAHEEDPTQEDETQKLHTPPAAEVRTRVPDVEIEQLRDVRFSTGFGGYNRKQVDDHLARVNRILAELQITASPESAIRHALAQVSEETRSLIEGAQRTAEEITARAKSDADERLERAAQQAQEQKDAAAQEASQLREAASEEAKQVREAAAREAAEVREAAEARVRELEADARSIAGERVRLIEGLREMTRGLDVYLDAAEQRHADVAPSSASEEEPPKQ